MQAGNYLIALKWCNKCATWVYKKVAPMRLRFARMWVEWLWFGRRWVWCDLRWLKHNSSIQWGIQTCTAWHIYLFWAMYVCMDCFSMQTLSQSIWLGRWLGRDAYKWFTNWQEDENTSRQLQQGEVDDVYLSEENVNCDAFGRLFKNPSLMPHFVVNFPLATKRERIHTTVQL